MGRNVSTKGDTGQLAAGGAVFSTGSIVWCGSPRHNCYRNNVARITESVRFAFASNRAF